MTMRRFAVAALGVALLAGASTCSLAQDNPKPQLQLSGSYQVKNVVPSDDGTVNFDFSATIVNDGADDVSGKLLLRDYSNNETVWARFGDNTISAGSSVKVSANVTVPKNIYKDWSGGASPPVYIYAEDSRGDLTMVNIPMVRGTTPKSGK